MTVLVDTSIWVDYFREGKSSQKLDILLDENMVAINDLILAELIPFLRMKNQRRLIMLLRTLHKHDLGIDWKLITEYQYECLKKGINGIGIPDLIIAQNALQHDAAIYSFDGHFKLLSNVLKIKLFS